MLCLQILSSVDLQSEHVVTSHLPVDGARQPKFCRESEEYMAAARQLLALLKRNAPIGPQTEEKLSKCISEALENPGGLFRAELAHRMAEGFGLPRRLSDSIACASEYFHIASLLLDDLPAMDDSMERRGRICPHLLYGEGTAILAALGLITRAYALLGESITLAPSQSQQPAHECIERCLGTRGIVNGQARDLASPKEARGGRYAATVALQKTVPLIALPLLLPALIAGAGADAILELRRLAVYWGLFYQGVDDLIDILAPTRFSGKTSGRDQSLGRPSIARELGIDGAGCYLDRLSRISEGSVKRLGADYPGLKFLTDFHFRLARRRNAVPIPG